MIKMDKEKFELIRDKIDVAMDIGAGCDDIAIMVFVGQKEIDGLRYTSGAQGGRRTLAAVIHNCLVDEPNLLAVVEAAVEKAKEELATI